MSEKLNKTGLSSGSSWSLFAENTAFEESDAIVGRLGNAAETTRLHAEDIEKYGLCPSRQSLQLAICDQCNKLLILSAVQRHYERNHSKVLSSVKPSPPKRCPSTTQQPAQIKTSYSKSKVLKSNNKSFIRIEEVDPNDSNVKIEEVPLTIPQFNSLAAKVKLPKINIKKLNTESKKNNGEKTNVSPQVCIQVKGSIKKIPQLKEKEYDCEKHCGVWIPEMEKNCTRSLTCKTHPLSLRRQVPGRSKDFDVLLADHRARVALKAQDNASNASSSPQSNSRGGTPVNSPFGFDKIVFPTVPGPLATNYNKDMATNLKSPRNTSHKSSHDDNQQNGYTELYSDYISDETLSMSNLPTLPYHPKPMKVNNFGGRQTDCRCRVFSRRMDHFRHATSWMLNHQYKNSSFTSVKQSNKNPSRTFQDGLRPAVQDPLQNGIIHKQKTKTSKTAAGVKRQFTEHPQGIIADPLSYAASSKRRHSSEVPVVDPFAVASQPNLSRSLSNPSQLAKIREVPEHKQQFLTNSLGSNTLNFITTTCGTNLLTGNFVSATGTLNVSSNSSLNLCQSLGVTPAASPQDSLDASFVSTTHVTAAPNVTITQGMIVSLPSAVLQGSQPTVYTIGSQIKDLISQSSPVQQIKGLLSQTNAIQQVASAGSALKQALSDVNLSSLHNGTNPLQKTENSTYSIEYCDADNQGPAPNITVTASPSLSGVLQGHVVSAAGSNLTKTTLKRLNSGHNDSSLLQQLIVQQSSNLDTHQLTGNYNKQIGSQSSMCQTIQSPKQVASSLTNMQASPRQTFLANPHHANNQPMKQLQKLQQIQQLQQQQQMQNQQFITMHHSYQQQILPKLPTVPQNISQFNTAQYTPTQTPSSLQFISQSTSNKTIQQQHGGTIS